MLNLKKLRDRHKEITELDWNLMAAHVVKKPKEFIYTHREIKLNLGQYLKMLWVIKKYTLGYPIAYLTNKKEFYGIDLFINKHVLIPRADSEIMVEEAIKIINEENIVILIDVGTGSGCIPIAILKNINKKIETIATDFSLPALLVAQKNSAQHKLKINFRKGNLLQPIKNINFENKKILITANLPYLKLEQIKDEKSIKKEPYSALYGGQDGLDLYKQLILQIKEKDYASNTQLCILLEIDPEQTEKIKEMIAKEIPKAQIKIRQDLAGLDRLVIINFSL
mgnify:CR=1 FL=1